MDTAWWLLYPMTDSPLITSARWLQRYMMAARRPCGHLRENVPPASPILIRDPGELVTLSFLVAIPTTVIRGELWELLEKDLMRVCDVIDLCDDNGHPLIGGGKGLWSLDLVTLRGNKTSNCWRCAECNQLFYDPRGKWYLIDSDVGGREIALTKMGGLVVNHRIATVLQQARQKWKAVHFRPIPVLSKPRDGFPLDLSETPQTDERKQGRYLHRG